MRTAGSISKWKREPVLDKLFEQMLSLIGAANVRINQPCGFGEFLGGESVAEIVPQTEAPEEQRLENPFALGAFLRCYVESGQFINCTLEIEICISIVLVVEAFSQLVGSDNVRQDNQAFAFQNVVIGEHLPRHPDCGASGRKIVFLSVLGDASHHLK